MDSERYNLNGETTELNFEKLLGSTVSAKTPISICFNLLQFYISVPSLVFAVLFELSFNALSAYFQVSLNLVTNSHYLNLLKFL